MEKDAMNDRPTHDFSRISIYVQKYNQPKKPLERLQRLGQKCDRPLNYMICLAVLDFLKRNENESEN